MIDDDKKQEIARILKERIGKFECPMCHQTNFSLIDGYFHCIMQDSIGQSSLSGMSVPSVAIICSNCGFMSQHALGALGLLNKYKNTDQPEN